MGFLRLRIIPGSAASPPPRASLLRSLASPSCACAGPSAPAPLALPPSPVVLPLLYVAVALLALVALLLELSAVGVVQGGPPPWTTPLTASRSA